MCSLTSNRQPFINTDMTATYDPVAILLRLVYESRWFRDIFPGRQQYSYVQRHRLTSLCSGERSLYIIIRETCSIATFEML